MPASRKVAVAIFGARIAYGVGLVAIPARLTRRWLGPAAGTAPTQVGVRGLGAREVVLHLGALTAAVRGQPLRPWLAASIAGDVADIASTTAARGALPEGSAAATLVVAGGSAAISAALAVLVES
jgi:hypothetical protein